MRTRRHPRRILFTVLAATVSAALGTIVGRFAAESVWGWIYFQVLVTDDRYSELWNAVVVVGMIAGAATGIALALLESWMAILTIPIHFVGCTIAACVLAIAVGYQGLWPYGWPGGLWWLVVLGVFFGWQALVVRAALGRLIVASARPTDSSPACGDPGG